MKKWYDVNNIYELYGKSVRVYFNLHKKTWSIKDRKTNRVLGWSDKIFLRECNMIVSEKGRQRVLRDKRKNVHAYVDGILTANDYDDTPYAFTYNPYKYDSFIVKGTDEKLNNAPYVKMVVTNNKPSTTFRRQNYECTF